MFHRLVRCQMRRHGEAKGTQRRHNERGGICTWCPLLAEPMSLVPPAINVGTLSGLKL